jgi:hypothetical protein
VPAEIADAIGGCADAPPPPVARAGRGAAVAPVAGIWTRPISAATSTRRQLRETARERGEDKVAVPGVIEVLKGLRAAADRRGRPAAIHFSPPARRRSGRPSATSWRSTACPTTASSRDQLQLLRRGKFGSCASTSASSWATLPRAQRARRVHSGELLFGDDWESDALTY